MVTSAWPELILRPNRRLHHCIFQIRIWQKCVHVLTDADEIQAVFAGSALWLDCRSLVQPIHGLIQVAWYRDHELLYYQYLVSDHLVSYPPNTTAGLMFHARASCLQPGHVTLWPVAPGEGGVYSCQVLMSHDVQRRKTISIFVCELSCFLRFSDVLTLTTETQATFTST